MLGRMGTRFKGLSLALAPLLSLAIACAVKPAEKVAHGEDQGLVSKAELLGRPLADVAVTEGTLVGKPQVAMTTSAKVKALLREATTQSVAIDVGESYVTIKAIGEAGAMKPVLQYRIKGHYDLKPQTNPDGVKTQYLVRDETSNLRWQDREFVSVDALDPLTIKADDDVLTYLYAVDSLRDHNVQFASEADLPWLAPTDRAELVALFDLKVGDQLKTTLSRTKFSILKVAADGTAMLIAQAPASYVDLVRAKTTKGELTPDLKRDQVERDWSLRTYVVLDPDAVKLAKPAKDLMDNLYDKKTLAGQTFVYGKVLIPILDETPELAAVMAKVDTTKLVLGDKVELRVAEMSVDVLINGELALKYPVQGHFDVTNAKDADGELVAQIVLDAKAKVWSKRRYVQVLPELVEPAHRDDSLRLASHQILQRALLNKKCLLVSSLPSEILKSTALAAGAALTTEVCIDIAQTILTMKTKDGAVLATFDVQSNFDIAHDADADTGEVDRLLTRDVSKPNWADRGYIEISSSNPHLAETHVREGALRKSDLEGEFIYTATVVAAHSENGLLPEGYNLQSTDRLTFTLGEGTLTAYKVHETLNQSTARSPVLRYGADHFDIERLKNGYGDATNITAETRDRPWSELSYVGVDFSSNEIPSYFNDLLGLDKLYFGTVFTARSIRVGDVKIDNDLISFETEEVLTPNARSGFMGAGETQLEPIAIRIRHNFMKVGQRTYVAKEYDRFDFARFGYFRATEAGLDPERGKTDETLKHFAQRFDVANGKHIDYYLSANFPEKFKDEAREVVAAWNVAFKAALGRDDVMILQEDVTPEHGDPRVNMIVYIDGYSSSAPLGYGPSFFDPLTGENLSAKAYIYGDGIKGVMASASDYYDLATGGRTGADFMTTRTVPVSSGSALPPVVVTAMPRRTSVAKAMVAAAPKVSSLHGLDVLKKLSTMTTVASEAASSKNATELTNFGDELKQRLKGGMVASLADRHQGCLMQPDFQLASAIKFIDSYKEKSKADVMAELESRMVFTTMLHEVGHNLGLRHNFQGSFDESNFPAQYHKLKTLGTSGEPAPAVEGEWLYKYRGSSVMDYSDDFEALFKSAGPYDVAAIKYGYGDKLEKVVGIDDTGAFVTEDLSKNELDAAKVEILAANPEASDLMVDRIASNQLHLRPYLFCTDEHVENDPTCQRFDRGVTVTEIAQSLVDDYETIYKLYGFRRGRRAFMGGSSSVMSRYVLPLRQLVDEYIYNLIYDGFPRQDSLDGSVAAASPSDYLGGINIGISFFDKVLNTVEPGTYHLDEAKGELVSGRLDGAKNVVISQLQGKYLEAASETVGNEERVTHRGIEYDKLAVLYAMSMRGFPANKYERASLSLNYFDLLKSFTMDRFSAVMRDELTVDMVAAQPLEGADFVPTAGDVDASDLHVLIAKIRPNTSLAIRQMASIFAMSNYGTSADRTFGDYVAVRRKGIDAIFPAGTETLEFTSVSGLNTYVVPNTSDKQSISFKIAEKAVPAAIQLQTIKDGMDHQEDLTPLRLAAIDLFGQMWAIGQGEAMGVDVVDLLTGNLDAYLGAITGLANQWVDGEEDPAKHEELVNLKAALDAQLAVLTQKAEDAEALAAQKGDLERDLVRYESDLLFLRDMNALFGAL